MGTGINISKLLQENLALKAENAAFKEELLALSKREFGLEKIIKNSKIKDMYPKSKIEYSYLKSKIQVYSYYKENIGKFIYDTFDIEKYAKGNTIDSYYKKQLCKKAIENMREYNDLSEKAKDLAEKIYSFIKEQNKNIA